MLIVLTVLLALYISWSIGSNDETMGTLAGCGYISMGRAVLIGAIADALGAILLGYRVEETIGRGLISVDLTYYDIFVIMVSMATWLIISSAMGIPISTTHSIVGAVTGLGAYKYGLQSLNLKSLVRIAAGWILSPLIGVIMAYFMEKFVSMYLKRRVRGLIDRLKVGRFSGLMLLVWTTYTSFFRGANDIANATSFISLMFDPILARTICGIGMAVGVLTLGRRVVRTVGEELVELDPVSALAVQISVASTLSIGTMLGLPLSGSQILVAAIIGIGLARGSWINIQELKHMILTWITTFPGAAILAIAFAYVI